MKRYLGLILALLMMLGLCAPMLSRITALITGALA